MIVLRVEQKLNHLEETLPEAPPATATEQELFETVKAFHACKQEDGQSVSSYLLKMKGYLDQMERLGYPMPKVLGVSLILTSLSKDYEQFVLNYNMHSMGKTSVVYDTACSAVLVINKGQIQKTKPQAHGKGYQGKGKQVVTYAPKVKIPPHVY